MISRRFVVLLMVAAFLAGLVCGGLVMAVWVSARLEAGHGVGVPSWRAVCNQTDHSDTTVVSHTLSTSPGTAMRRSVVSMGNGRGSCSSNGHRSTWRTTPCRKMTKRRPAGCRANGAGIE